MARSYCWGSREASGGGALALCSGEQKYPKAARHSAQRGALQTEHLATARAPGCRPHAAGRAGGPPGLAAARGATAGTSSTERMRISGSGAPDGFPHTGQADPSKGAPHVQIIGGMDPPWTGFFERASLD